jgi:hypothetical protein
MASFGEYLPVGMGGSFMVWYMVFAGVTAAGDVVVPAVVALTAVVSATGSTRAVEVVRVDEEVIMTESWSGWPWTEQGERGAFDGNLPGPTGKCASSALDLPGFADNNLLS